MAQFTVTLNAKANNPPSAIGYNTITISDPAYTYVFTLADFVTNTTPPYADPEGDAAFELKIISLPDAQIGVLNYDSVPVIAGDIVPLSGVDSGLLNLVPVEGPILLVFDFDFDLSDVGSNTFSGLADGISYGVMHLIVGQQVNQPPTVGDGDQTIEWASTLVFTRVMFTTLTVPAYSDPEGDIADQLKILSLPVDGILKLDGLDIVINQVIDFTDIDSGLFTYVSDLVDEDGDIETFQFAISDVGSGIFVE